MKLTLIGGEEFANGFESVHEALIGPIADGHSRGIYVPTCAANDGLEVVNYWCTLAQHRLQPYAASVEAPLIIDRTTANDERNVSIIRSADWIYLGGGHPATGMKILEETRALEAIIAAALRGTPILGASAGAMMMCATSMVITPALYDDANGAGGYDVDDKDIPEYIRCLGLVPQMFCIPHFNTPWASAWAKFQPAAHSLLGIDEQTALTMDESQPDDWRVIGRARVVLNAEHIAPKTYVAGDLVQLPQYKRVVSN